MTKKRGILFVTALILLSTYSVCGMEETINLVEKLKFNDKENYNIDIFPEKVEDNDLINPVDAPSNPIISGPSSIELHNTYVYFIRSKDQQNDDIQYKITFSDTPAIYLTDFYSSGESVSFYHSWSTFYQKTGPYYIYAKAIDSEGHESKWAKFEVTIPDLDQQIPNPCLLCSFLERIFEKFPILEVLIDF